jgi:fructosamine-3-kinase
MHRWAVRLHEVKGAADESIVQLQSCPRDYSCASIRSVRHVADPACYYGHHEAEFGMSWCAGFSPAFWDAYHSVLPRSPGFEDRHKLYTLYHYLNHYVLFGGGYAGNCLRLFQNLLQKV